MTRMTLVYNKTYLCVMSMSTEKLFYFRDVAQNASEKMVKNNKLSRNI